MSERPLGPSSQLEYDLSAVVFFGQIPTAVLCTRALTEIKRLRRELILAGREPDPVTRPRKG